jgi:hypothetical protein
MDDLLDHILVTIRRNSLCNNASMGFDPPPASICITHYISIAYRPDGGNIPPTPAFVRLSRSITPNNVIPFWARFGRRDLLVKNH